MTVNERIRHFTKNILHINQRQFASDLGMAQTGVSSMEQDGATVTNRAIKSICMAYNLNENWLRHGIEPMYIQEPTFSLDKFVKDHDGTDLELEAMKAYFELDQDIRKMLVKYFKEWLTAVRNKSAKLTMTVEEPAELTATVEEPAEPIMTVEEAEAVYIKSRSNRAQKTVQSALNISADIGNPAEKRNTNRASNQ